ncbi:hypothetical protein L208DRAFT_1404718 [Tricholoma matsutake]|nr:hypothetical protein L208DRAFT_1404718 [Tricholoma matsutake 945]
MPQTDRRTVNRRSAATSTQQKLDWLLHMPNGATSAANHTIQRIFRGYQRRNRSKRRVDFVASIGNKTSSS